MSWLAAATPIQTTTHIKFFLVKSTVTYRLSLSLSLKKKKNNPHYVAIKKVIF